MTDQLRHIKQRALLNIVLSLAVVVITFQLFKGWGCLVLAVIAGFGLWLSGRSFIRLIRAHAVEYEQMRQFRDDFRRQIHRTTLPRQVFMLLFAVAEVDGASEREERELVRHFVLQRFTDPVHADDLRSWEAQRVPPEQIDALARNMGQILSDSECETVFAWCCMVAFADGSFAPEEHIVLQSIARCFDMESHHARRIFHHAKQAHMSGDPAGAFGGDQRTGGSRARGRVSNHGEALAVLGLEQGASKDDIRTRHRELVKRYHPDKHIHLGPVAAKEAEERFREVQSAYEVLVG